MRIYNSDLRRAWRWLKRGRPAKTIRFLEPKVPLFLEDPQFYALLGRACLETGDLGGAEFYFKRGLQSDPELIAARLGMAVVALKKKDTPTSVRYWLEIVDENPNNRYARRGLEALRKISNPAMQERFFENVDHRRFLPALGRRWPRWILPAALASLIILLGVYFRGEISQIFRELDAPRRSGAENIRIEGALSLVDPAEDVLYPLAASEVEKTFRRALRHFDKYEDNRSRVELNRIKYSNASSEVKSEALALEALLAEPEFDTLRFRPSFAEVSADPWLYDGCWVLWRGKVSNVVFGENAILFDFLVGYDTGQVLEGLVPVKVPFAVSIEAALPLELLARVAVEDGQITLEARTLHFIRN